MGLEYVREFFGLERDLLVKLLPLCLSQRFANRFKKLLPHLGGNAFLLSVNCQGPWLLEKKQPKFTSSTTFSFKDFGVIENFCV
jgi:hypothetical protein